MGDIEKSYMRMEISLSTWRVMPQRVRALLRCPDCVHDAVNCQGASALLLGPVCQFGGLTTRRPGITGHAT